MFDAVEDSFAMLFIICRLSWYWMSLEAAKNLHEKSENEWLMDGRRANCSYCVRKPVL